MHRCLNILTLRQLKVIEDFDQQLGVLRRIFPDKVETGNNPETFKWMVNRVADGTGKPAPRELIHLSEAIRKEQVSQLERGEDGPSGEQLFDRSVFKIALREVSRVRYDQTFVAENPSLREYTDRLKGQKSEQSVVTLAQVWGCDEVTAQDIAERLVKAGFFIEKRDKGPTASYWTPFIYRDALELVQGAA